MTVLFLRRWAITSQQQSRRNAMLASTVLTQRRLERMEVEEFLASLSAPAVRQVAARG